jgi:hypothetical protein
MRTILRCECGQPLSKCIYVVERRHANRWIHYRCIECSREWSIREDVDDLADPVSSSEVLEVRRLVESSDLPELFRP